MRYLIMCPNTVTVAAAPTTALAAICCRNCKKNCNFWQINYFGAKIEAKIK